MRKALALVIWGAFHSTKNSGNSGFGSEWNRHFPEFHSEILGVPREVGLKFRKIGITGKFRSIRPFLSARAQFLRARKSNSTWLPIFLLNISVPLVIMRQMFFCTTFAPEPRQTFVSSTKMHISYAQCLQNPVHATQCNVEPVFHCSSRLLVSHTPEES